MYMWGNQSENSKAVKGLLQTVGKLRGFTNIWHKINDGYSEIRILGPLSGGPVLWVNPCSGIRGKVFKLLCCFPEVNENKREHDDN